MDNEIKKGDTMFTTADFVNDVTMLKTYTCTKTKHDAEGVMPMKIYFIDDNGSEDWHYNNMFTKTKEATPTPVVKPHQWADVIHQWADGAEIQSLVNGVNSSVWVTITDPLFTQNGQYRIKPSEEEEQKEKIDNQHQRMTKAFKHYQNVCDESFKEIKRLKGKV